jgi:hypothetical protein
MDQNKVLNRSRLPFRVQSLDITKIRKDGGRVKAERDAANNANPGGCSVTDGTVYKSGMSLRKDTSEWRLHCRPSFTVSLGNEKALPDVLFAT